VLDLAVRLGLSARIGARTPRSGLEREIGGAAARAFGHHAAACAAQATRLDQVIAEICAAAVAMEVPIALLKFAALSRLGCLAPGGRWACDIDVLAPEPVLERLAAALEGRGWKATGAAYEHQLPALTHALGGSIELHRLMLGVRLTPRRRSASFEELERQALLERCAGEASGVWLPRPDVLAAHAIAHGLGQHGFEPGSYPHFRLVGDLQDLRLGDDPGSLARIERWLERALPASEIRALVELVRRLSDGEDAPEGGAAGGLLAHFLAGALDRSYRESLKLSRQRMPFSDAPRPLAAARAARRAVFPSRAELSAIYGVAGSRREAWRQRLARPFDLLARFAVSVSARRRQDLSRPLPERGRPSLWSPFEWARIVGSIGAVSFASLRIAWLLRARTVLQAAPRLREGRKLPLSLRSPWRLAAVADRLLWALPPWSLGPCLKRSLVLLEVWSRCGVEARLHLGLRREAAGVWEGHAWLSAEGDPPVEAGYSEMAVV
jgi:hypothetical protein